MMQCYHIYMLMTAISSRNVTNGGNSPSPYKARCPALAVW